MSIWVALLIYVSNKKPVDKCCHQRVDHAEFSLVGIAAFPFGFVAGVVVVLWRHSG